MGLLKKKQKPIKETKKESPGFTNPIQAIFTPQQGQNPITDSERLINAWLDEKKLHMKTTLTQNQVNSVTILYSLAVQFNIVPLKDLLDNFIKFMISKDSASAKQLVSILESRGLMDQSDVQAISKFAK